MLSVRGQFLFLFVLQLYLLGEANNNVEFKTNFQTLYNFMEGLRNASGSLQNFFTNMQAMFCPEQPICSSEGIKDRDRVLLTLPQYLDIGTSSILVESISDIVGICCLPCSCSDTCFAHGYCCLSKLFNKSAAEQESSDIFTMFAQKRDDETRSVGDISNASLTDIRNATFSMIDTSIEIPGRSECVHPTVRGYDREDTQSFEDGYFMVTSCIDKTTNKNLVRKCEEPSVDVFDETVPVTSLRTNQTYWNQHCAMCNNDDKETMDWSSVGVFGDELVFFANTSDVQIFPSNTAELHRLIIYRGDIFYSPPFPMEDKRCLLRLNECEEQTIVGGKNVRDIPWLLEACKQYTSPIQKKQFFTTTRYRTLPFRNIFCFFCREKVTGLLENSPCNLNVESSRFTSTRLTGVIDYKGTVDQKSSVDGQLAHGIGHCLCGEVYDKNSDRCRPILCPPGDFMSGCQCVQLVKHLSGVPILMYLKVEPKSGKLAAMTAKKIRSYNAALSKTLQNTVNDITVEHVATFKQATETGENFLSLVLIRSNPDHDTKQTLKPFLDYLDSPRKMEMLAGKTVYSMRLTSRVRMWEEWENSSLTFTPRLIDFDVKDQDPPLIHSNDGSLGRAYIQSVFQVFSPLLYCRQVLLDGSEFFEQDGTLVLNITSPELSTPYYYCVSPNKARVCVKLFLRNPKNRGAEMGHAISALLVLFGYILLYCG